MLIPTYEVTGRSRHYKHTIKNPDEIKSVFKKGEANKKLGSCVTRGKWKGARIFSLALEERATCPRTCVQWSVCYGNNMPFAHRINHLHPNFYAIMKAELDKLDLMYRRYVMRLHVLGDFFSAEYCDWWKDQFKSRNRLHAWGYTAHNSDSVLGLLVNSINKAYPERACIRFSDSEEDFMGTAVINDINISPPRNHVICPEQLGTKPSCGECTLCWSSPKTRILFNKH